MPERAPLSDQSAAEWRVLWATGQTTVGFTAPEQAEQLLAKKSVQGEIQSRRVTAWTPVALDEDAR